MAIIGEWIRRLGYLLRRRHWEDELRREIEAHRALMDEPGTFGNPLRLRDEARDAWGWRWLDDLLQDGRVAARMLAHAPAFTLTAIVTLALGIGVNTGMFSVINAVVFRPLYAGADDVVRVHQRSTAPSGRNRAFSYLNYRDVQDGTADVFAELAASVTGFVGLDFGDGARMTYAAGVTANYFEVFAATPALGRGFTADEERPGAGIRAAIISHSLWEQRGADSGILGRLVRINGDPFTIVGVAAKGFGGTSIPGPNVWLPLGAHETFRTGRQIGARDVHTLSVVGRLRSDVRRETAEAALVVVGRRLEQAFPSVNAGYSLALSTPDGRLLFLPGNDGLTGAALLLMLMPAIVLLVACLNLADLLLARGHARRREIAIRSSLGGGRSRLIRQLLTEGWLLALAGAAIGLWLSTWTVEALLASLAPLLPVGVSLPDVSIDWRVLAAGAAFSLVATLIFAAGPAWSLSGRARLAELERHTVEQSRRPGGLRIGNVLVVGQIALSLVLLASGGLFTLSVVRASSVDPGFRLDGGVLVQIDPGLAGYDEARGRQTQLALLERLRALPGVDVATIGSRVPFTGIGESRDVVPAGTDSSPDARPRSVDAAFSVVGRDYARGLGLAMIGGRDFTDGELSDNGGERVAIVDDVLAEALWPGGDAIGRLIQFLDSDGPAGRQALRVVGIIPAVKHSLGNPYRYPHVYVPLGQHYQSATTLQLRLAESADERAMLGTIANVVREVDDRLPILGIATRREHLDAGVDVLIQRAAAGMFASFAGIALLIAALGVYGVKSYVVARRTREFGIRMAIGADRRVLLWQVMREGGRLTAIGIGIGLLLALVAGQLLQGVLYGVSSVEPVVLVTASAILLGAAMLASFVPALRATRVDPTVALRSE
jgi:predicted permease